MRLKPALNCLKQLRCSTQFAKVWHSHEDSLEFLLSTTEDDVPLYIGGTDFFLFSLVVPLAKLQGDYIEDLMGWNFGVSSGYSYGYSYPESVPVPYLGEPMEHTSSSILDGTMPIFFLRFFPGCQGDRCYVEINQRISHVLDIHWIEEKQSWCKLNDLGEIVQVARRVREGDITYCTLGREEMDFFLFFANACLVRVFDVPRFSNWQPAQGESSSSNRYDNASNEIFAVRTLHGDPNEPVASHLRGFQIIRCKRSREEMLLKLEGKPQRQHATFLISDWKNKVVREWTSDPSQLGNYFVKSELPYGTSPVFFKPNVLLQYRQDPSRYTIKDRDIECRGAWSLPYDVNEEGQVHAYICDLSNLPYQEQLHWKAFNEEPKSGISARAFKTDFQAQWDDSYNPLESLKSVLTIFPQTDRAGKECVIWKMPKVADTRDINFLGHVVTDSRKEWEDQVLCLAQILVDGLNSSYINRLADSMKCRDKRLASGKQLAKVLETIGLTQEQVQEITKPLAELWKLRSSIVAHPGGSLPEPNLRKHFRELLERCDLTMKTLTELVQSGRLAIHEAP